MTYDRFICALCNYYVGSRNIILPGLLLIFQVACVLRCGWCWSRGAVACRATCAVQVLIGRVTWGRGDVLKTFKNSVLKTRLWFGKNTPIWWFDPTLKATLRNVPLLDVRTFDLSVDVADAGGCGDVVGWDDDINVASSCDVTDLGGSAFLLDPM